MDILNLLIVLFLFLLTFVCAEFLYKRKMPASSTRKIVHIGGGVIAAFLPVFISLEMVVILGIGFFLILTLSKWKNLLNSIHKIDNESLGALLFAPSITLTAIIFWPINPLIFQGAALVLGLSDGVAGLVGEKYGKRKYNITGIKTIEGSLTFFVITVLILSSFLYVNETPLLSGALFVFSVALLLTLVESAFGKGWDNFFIPIITALMLYLIL